MNKSKQSLGCFVIVLSRFVLVLSRVALVLCRVVLVLPRIVLVFSGVASCCTRAVLCCVGLSRVVLCYYSCSFLDYVQQNRTELSVTDSMTLDAHRVNELSANITKWSNTLKQFVRKLPTNCLSVFDHFVGLALKELKEASDLVI